MAEARVVMYMCPELADLLEALVRGVDISAAPETVVFYEVGTSPPA